MAYDEVYVDPSINANSGAGTIGDPYGDLQYAIDSEVFGADTIRFNIKAGTAEVLTAPLDIITNFSATTTGKIVVFEGYTSTAGDGGVGEIEGDTNSVGVVASASTPGNVAFRNLTIRGGDGTTPCIHCGTSVTFYRCTITGFKDAVLATDNVWILNCHIKYSNGTTGGLGIHQNAWQPITFWNYVEAINASSSHAIQISNTGNSHFNIIDLRNVTASGVHGIYQNTSRITACHNTIIGHAGDSSYGIGLASVANSRYSTFINNYIEGFTGTGSYPIQTGRTEGPSFFKNNKWFNCTNDFVMNNSFELGRGNSSVAGSGLTDLDNDDFRPTSYLVAAGYPGSFKGIAGMSNYPDIGAVQISS